MESAAFIDAASDFSTPWDQGATGGAVEETKVTLQEVLSSCKRNASVAMKASNYPRLQKIGKILGGLLKQFATFAKQAVEIAVLKFCVELAAMVVGAMTAAMFAKTGKNMDIASGGVFVNRGPVAPGAQAPVAQPPRSGFDANPFNEPSWGAPPTRSPW